MGWNPLKDIYKATLGGFDFGGGGLGDPLGIGAANDANKANKANLAKIGQLYTTGQGQLGQGYGKALALQKQATGTLRKGVTAGRLAIASQGDSARQTLLDREKVGVDTALGGMENNGINSAALADAVRRSHAYDTNSALSSIDEAIARLASQFELQGAGAVAGSQGQEGGIEASLAGQRANLTGNYMGILGNVQHTAAPGWGIELAKAISGFAH